MIIIIRALPQWGKDDGDYDSPTSRDETSEFTKIKEANEAHTKKGQRSPPNKKMREKEKGAMLRSFYHTCASE